MKGEPRISFRVLGLLLKSRGIVTKNRVLLWEIALGLVLYQLGLSLRRTALVLSRLGENVSHVAVWYWNRKVGVGFKPYSRPLPPVIVVGETCMCKLGLPYYVVYWRYNLIQLCGERSLPAVTCGLV